MEVTFWFFSKMVTTSWNITKKLKKTYEVKFCLMQKEISYIRLKKRLTIKSLNIAPHPPPPPPPHFSKYLSKRTIFVVVKSERDWLWTSTKITINQSTETDWITIFYHPFKNHLEISTRRTNQLDPTELIKNLINFQPRVNTNNSNFP